MSIIFSNSSNLEFGSTWVWLKNGALKLAYLYVKHLMAV